MQIRPLWPSFVVERLGLEKRELIKNRTELALI
jgi:hypothetical protein